MYWSRLAVAWRRQALGVISGLAVAAMWPGSACFGGATPANDNCSNATTAVLGLNPFSNIGATLAGPDIPCAPIDADVWFKFTSTFNGPLKISTCGDADFDTVIAIYSGC